MKDRLGMIGGTTSPSLLAIALTAAILAAVVAVALTPPPADPTVNTGGLFELGGAQAADIRGDGLAASGPDWAPVDDTSNDDGIFDANGDVLDLFGGVAASFIMDELSQRGPLDSTTFSGAGGSNKNNDAISDWHWDAGNVPAKDDLSNAYAYATTTSVGGAVHLIIYSGFERIDSSGDSHVDIEFFQDDVALDEDVPCNDPGNDPTPCSFVGTRTVEDIIVSMDFTNGGGFGTLSVREWNGIEYAPVTTLNGEGCNPADTVCGFNNGGLIDGGPWPNFNRHGNLITELPQNAFTEFGMDITALLGDTPCISTFMGKTRSSQSFTAELKDFAGPSAFNICGAAIQINPPLDTNEVGETHTFTVTVQKLVAGVEQPADDGTIVDVTLTAENGAVIEEVVDTCASPGTSGGTCTVSFTSNSAGKVTGHAAADVDVGPVTVHVETDGVAPNSGDAVKFFVDAFITINPPLDTNSVQETHVFTVNVQQDDGTGSGFQPVPEGTVVTVTLSPSGGASATGVVDTCASPGTSGGTCTVSFTSNSAGTIVGHASVFLAIGDLTLFRETDGLAPNSGDAVKVFVAGSLAWTKVDNAGRLQSGATFQVCRTHDLDSSSGQMVDVPDVCVSVLDNSAPDADPDGGEFLLVGLRLGRYTIDETAAPAGYAEDPKVETVDLTHANPDGAASSAFVNQRPIIKVTGFGYTNTPNGQPTDGVVSGTTVYTLKLKNFGGASGTLGGGLTVTFTPGTESSFSCDGPGGACTIDLSGIVLAGGEEMTFTLTVVYTNAPDGTQVTASLGVDYTLNGLTRTASGSPALILFTIQGD